MSLIIAYRDHELVEAVLSQLAEQTMLPRLALIVDNGGTLTEEDRARMPLADRSLLISRPDNPGYGVAVNLAREHLSDSGTNANNNTAGAANTALLVLTHDTVFGPGLAKRLLSVLNDRGHASVSHSADYSADFNANNSATNHSTSNTNSSTNTNTNTNTATDTTATGATATGAIAATSAASAASATSHIGSVAPLLHVASDPERLFSAGGRLARSGRASHWPRSLSPSPYSVDWVDGAIVMYSVAALERIGWLDEGYFLYFEDVDTGWRMSQANYKNVVVPDQVAYQEPGAHPPYLGMRNMALFARKASIPVLLSTGAAARRLARESLGRIRRGKSPQLIAAWRGWRDGRAGITGKPAR